VNGGTLVAMARTAGPAARTTLYRLARVSRLEQGIREKYRVNTDDFETHTLDFEGREAFLIAGAATGKRAGWAQRVSHLTGVRVNVRNVSAAGALLIRDEGETAWALTYGMGFQMLEHGFIEPAFGQRVLVRCADPDQLRSVTRTVLDYRSRTDRSSIPTGERPRGFGIGDFGEIVSQVIGRATIPDLTAGSKPVALKGSNALSVPLARERVGLLGDLESIRAVLAKDPLPDLESLEQFAAVKNPTVLDELLAGLNEAISAEGYDRLAMGWPQDRIDEHGPTSSYRLHGAGYGKTGPFDDLPTFDELRSALLERDAEDPVAAASALKVQLYSDAEGDEPASSAIPVLNWLAYETDLKGSRYCLHDGHWYQMDTDYADRLAKRVEKIFDRQSSISLPEWTDEYRDEDAYNKLVARSLGGAVLDKRLIRTDTHRRGIEPCDVLTVDGVPIHVKHIVKSSVASHLIAQALVSTDALTQDSQAREALRARVLEAGGEPAWLGDRLECVVLGMARRKPLTARSLFTFTQVTLARLDGALAGAGVTVYVVPIVDSRKPKPKRKGT